MTYNDIIVNSQLTEEVCYKDEGRYVLSEVCLSFVLYMHEQSHVYIIVMNQFVT